MNPHLVTRLLVRMLIERTGRGHFVGVIAVATLEHGAGVYGACNVPSSACARDFVSRAYSAPPYIELAQIAHDAIEDCLQVAPELELSVVLLGPRGAACLRTDKIQPHFVLDYWNLAEIKPTPTTEPTA